MRLLTVFVPEVEGEFQFIDEAQISLELLELHCKLDSSRCSYCSWEDKMSIPMGAHAAFKVRDNLNGEKGPGPGRNERQSNSSGFQHQQIPQNEMSHIPPVQYNGKLMNSIWGMYNRYSVHNIKSHIAYDKA